MEPNTKKRRVLLGMSLVAAILYLVNALVLWLELVLETDVLFEGSLLWRILDLRADIFTLLGFVLLFSCTIHATRAYGTRGALPLLLTIPALLALKYALEGFFILMRNGFDFFGFLYIQLPLTLESLLFELIIWGIVLLIAHICATSKYQTRPQLPLILISAFSAIVKILIRLIGDIAYGAPSSFGEVLYIIAAYIWDILLYGILLYLGIKPIIKKIGEQQE